MNLEFTTNELAFRDEVRDFLRLSLPSDLREAGQQCTGIYSDYAPANAWFKILAKKGWSVPSWPEKYGGTGWDPTKQFIFDRELALAGAPEITPNATHMLAPVLIEFGTEAQKARYLPAIRSGDDWWAQGYSEPGAGSDLASLRCQAKRSGDQYVLNGSKIWTTHAHFCNRIFCLVRTNTLDRPQKGISFLLVDLDLPGISIRPIISLSGEHELNEVFFDDVIVPVSSLLGPENEGWAVTKFLLKHERSHFWSPMLRARFERMRLRSRDLTADGPGRLGDDPLFVRKMAQAEIRLMALEIAEFRILAGNIDSSPPAAVPSMMKIVGTELRQHLTELALELEGARAIGAMNDARSTFITFGQGARSSAMYFNDRAASIYAGTNEVQRNIISKILID